MKAASWIWYGDGDASDVHPTGNGTAYVVSTRKEQVVLPVRKFVCGFGQADVGECSWTARDLA